jgi:hypothetical protein
LSFQQALPLRLFIRNAGQIGKMKKRVSEQFNFQLLEFELILWRGHPVTYRPRYVHLPPVFVLGAPLAVGFFFASMPISIFLKLFAGVPLGLIVLFVSLFLKAKPHITLVLTNKRVLVFNQKNEILRAHELKDVEIQRMNKDVFIVADKVADEHTIKWPFVCNEHPEILAIELQKLGAIHEQSRLT